MSRAWTKDNVVLTPYIDGKKGANRQNKADTTKWIQANRHNQADITSQSKSSRHNQTYLIFQVLPISLYKEFTLINSSYEIEWKPRNTIDLGLKWRRGENTLSLKIQKSTMQD